MKNSTFPHLRLIKKKELIPEISLSSTTIDLRINQGLLPPPIQTGDRGVAWLFHEIQEIIAAMASGRTKSEIRELVELLVQNRQKLLVSKSDNHQAIGSEEHLSSRLLTNNEGEIK